MAEQKKECAGPVVAGTGAELKAVNFYPDQYPISQIAATVFYWNRGSNSVERGEAL